MKKFKFTKMMLVLLIAVSMLFTTVMAASPNAVTVSDSLLESTAVADSSANLAETGEYALSIVNKPGTTFALSHISALVLVCSALICRLFL